MLLKKLEMENFLPFYLHAEIDFTPKNGNKIVLLHGNNGAGKSSTFVALNFVFFGAPVISTEKDEPLQIHDLVNTKKIIESDGISLVRVHFTHESENWSFTRKINFKKIDLTRDPDISNEEYAEKIKLLKKNNISEGEFIAVKNGVTLTWPTEPRKREKKIHQQIEDIIPKDSSRYYFFDGEEISKYTTVPPEDSIKVIIEKLLGVRMINNAIDDLKELKDEKYDKTIRDLGRKNAKTASLTKIADDAKYDLKTLKNNKNILEKEISNLSNNLSRYKSQLAGTEKIQNQLDEIEQKEKDLNLCKDIIVSAKKSLKEYYSNDLPILLTVELLDRLKNKKTLTSNTLPYISQTARICLTDGECICKRPLDVDSKDVLKQLAKKITNPLENFEEANSQLLGTYGTNGLTHRWTTRTSVLGDNIHEESELVREISEINSRIDRTINVGDMQEEIKILRSDQINAQTELEKKREELTTAKQRVETYQKIYDDAFKVVQKSDISQIMNEYNAYNKRCDQLINSFENIKNDIVRIQKSRIEDFASKILNEIAKPEAGLRGIVLDDKYTIMIKRPPKDEPFYTNDSPIPSKGEKQIIAMSFVLALTKFAGIERPIFIDTPFARIEPDYTINIANQIIDQNEQVVILYQSGELHKEGVQLFKSKSASAWEFTKLSEEQSTIEVIE